VIEARLTEREAIFDPGTLRAVALEQTAGHMSPEEALDLARSMVSERRVLTLEGGQMTTLAVRAQEQAIERRAISLSQDADREVGEVACEIASREVAERIGAPLSPEQETALRALTGPERLALLVGPAGTGKGVVIDAALSRRSVVRRSVWPCRAPPRSGWAPTAPRSPSAP
jgi:ATP-dependent exoDNAse (exonuclease V) alpha subunit